MCIGVLFSGEAGMILGKVEAISHDEFLGNFVKNGCVNVSMLVGFGK